MTLTLTYVDNDTGEETEVTIPSEKIVCPTCHGEGKHVNRAIDGNGLPQDCVEDPDFMEDYLSGVYDVPCEECGGKRVVDAAITEGLTELQHKALEQEAEYQNELAWERRMRERGIEW